MINTTVVGVCCHCDTL